MICGAIACVGKDDGDSGNASTGSSGGDTMASDTAAPVDPSAPVGDETGELGCTASLKPCNPASPCCSGLCRQDGLCGPSECAAEGASCEPGCCDGLTCDVNSMTCSATCLPFESPCEADADCCDGVCPADIGTCVGLG